MRGKGIGELLLADAVRRVLGASRALAVFGIGIEAKDAAASAFHEGFGFRPFPLRPRRLFLLAATAASAFERTRWIRIRSAPDAGLRGEAGQARWSALRPRQEVLEVRPHIADPSTPFLKGDQNGRLDASLGSGLQSLPFASDKQFSEARFRIPRRPSFHVAVSLEE